MALIQMEFKSETLKRTVSANVILPSERFRGPYPTLYLLHGLTDNCNGWLSYTRIRLWAEESGLAVVMPSGENSFYMDILVKDGCLGDFGSWCAAVESVVYISSVSSGYREVKCGVVEAALYGEAHTLSFKGSFQVSVDDCVFIGSSGAYFGS